MFEQKPCPFCMMEELQGDRILERGKNYFVILSNPFLVPGHTLVIPRRHVSALSHLTSGERTALLDVAACWADRLKAIFSKSWGQIAGCDFSQHDRLFMPTTTVSVPGHLHFHLRPRRWQDELYQEVQRHETSMFDRQQLTTSDVERYKVLFGVE